MNRNPPWTRDELILALDLYFTHNPLHISKNHPEVEALSAVLKQLPIHPAAVTARDTFRNPAGAYMKLGNFLRLDPSCDAAGLSAGSQMDEVIWQEFAHDIPRLRRVAAAIRKCALSQHPTQYSAVINEPVVGEELYPEGRILFRLHHYLETDRQSVDRKKGWSLERFGLCRCEVCGVSYEEYYGPLGEGLIECHHKLHVSAVPLGYKTKVDDLALVCANCHLVLHKGGERLTVEALRTVVQSAR